MSIIEVKELVKNYKEVQAVKNISFNVEEGSFFAFLGVNGAGKSTTINILCTVLEKTSGQVFIDGFDLSKDKEKIRDIIGIVFQGNVLDSILTVKENLYSRCSYYGLDKKNKKKRVEELSKILELEDVMNQKYGTLSGGQRRRVDIARALINNPKILFLDEPTTGLDPQTRILVWNIIHKLRIETKLTVFLTTHYMEETAECDNVVIIDGGKIVAMDNPHMLKLKYAKNKIIWYTNESKENSDLLDSYRLEYSYINTFYKISIDNDFNITSFLYENKNTIRDYEVIKGDMDDVFLNVTGKKLGD